jgi:pyruvate dehydrogenase E2 component (dihydrolipoamide acetyltransferase)
MPSLGADMEAGTLVEWLVKPGDKVKRGDIVAVVDTQKGAIEIEIFEDGQIEEILVSLNDKVPVGTALARIRTEAEMRAAPPPPPAAKPPPPVAQRVPPPKAMPSPPPLPRQPLPPPPPMPAAAAHPRVSPAARRLAEERRIDLAAVVGSGPEGAIVRADVERSRAVAPAPAPAAPEKKRAIGIDLDAMRAAIAAAMARSKREIPHYYLEHQVDVTAAEQWLTAPMPIGRPTAAC